MGEKGEGGVKKKKRRRKNRKRNKKDGDDEGDEDENYGLEIIEEGSICPRTSNTKVINLEYGDEGSTQCISKLS